MTRVFLVSLALALGGCATNDFGYILPDACKGDLSAIPVERVALPRSLHGRTVSVVIQGQRYSRVEVSDRLTGEDFEAAARHEKCHHLLGNWHR